MDPGTLYAGFSSSQGFGVGGLSYSNFLACTLFGKLGDYLKQSKWDAEILLQGASAC